MPAHLFHKRLPELNRFRQEFVPAPIVSSNAVAHGIGRTLANQRDDGVYEPGLHDFRGQRRFPRLKHVRHGRAGSGRRPGMSERRRRARDSLVRHEDDLVE